MSFGKTLRRFFFRCVQLAGKITGKIQRTLFPVGNAPAPRPRVAESRSEGVRGKVIVITGSSKGIGLALAKGFLKEGASVVINGRREEDLKKAFEECRKISPDVEAVAADLSDENNVEKLISSAMDRFGKIDVLVNNAAMTGKEGRKFWDVDPREYEQVMKVNVTAPFVCASHAIRNAAKTGHKIRIINVSSGIVGYGAPKLGVYNVSKTALEGLTVSFAADCENDGLVSVLNIQPRSVKTRMTESYFDRVNYELMDDPDVLFPVFLYAAQAPAGEIMGKTLSDPRFAADPKAEIYLSDPSVPFANTKIAPETFQKKVHETGEEDGGYLHLLQNPIGMYPSVRKVLEDHAADKKVCRYPDPNYTALRDALAEHHNLDPACFTFGTGSSEIIIRAIRALGADRGKVIVTRPTWGSCIWPTILKSGLIPVDVPISGSVKNMDLCHNLDGILDAIDFKTRVIYLVNPCNPTGSMVDKKDLKRFLSEVPSHVTVLLDEAYLGYAEPEKRYDLSADLDNISCPVIGLRTFSKFFSMAGMRVGYAYGKPDDLALIDRWDFAFNISTIAQFCAMAAVRDTETQKQVYAHNHQERLRIYQELDALGIDYLPTQTSFIMFDCPRDRGQMRGELQKKGLYLPNVDDAAGENFAVLPIGKKEHNDIVIEYLRKL